MSPPFRGKEHQDGLWAGLASGSLQVVATDHAAFNTEQKRMGRDNFCLIPNGSNGLEERLAVMETPGHDRPFEGPGWQKGGGGLKRGGPFVQE